MAGARLATDDVIYSVESRAAVWHLAVNRKARMAGLLLAGAMDRLLVRDGFRRTIARAAEADARTDEDASAFPKATIPQCTPGRSIAEDAEDLLRGVVVIQGQNGFGSGFFVSPEGLVLTAAHVINTLPLKLRLRDGTQVEAVPVRVSPRADVALLRTTAPLSGHACAAIRTAAPVSGADVYAAGAPESLDLAFSLTRGIVSGFPVIGGHRRIQTDASVSPGNSGGPLADAQGLVVGIISSKVVESKAEGLAFAVPMREALAALGLEVGTSTDPGLLSAMATLAPAEPDHVFHDTADAVPSLDPEGDARREAEREKARLQREHEEEERDRDRRTPKFVPAMRWGGLALSIVGAAGVVGTYVNYDAQHTTEPTFKTLRAWNTAAWVAAAAGAASFGLSFAFRPPPRPHRVAPDTAFVLGPAGVAWRATF